MFLKFELEVLCKALEVEINTLSSPNILITLEGPWGECRSFEIEILETETHEVTTSSCSESRFTTVKRVEYGGGAAGINNAPMPTLSLESMSQNDGSMIPNLPSYVRVNPSIVLFQRYPDLKRAVPMAVNSAIREIINPVVERSVTIACITAKEMVNKDFTWTWWQPIAQGCTTHGIESCGTSGFGHMQGSSACHNIKVSSRVSSTRTCVEAQLSPSSNLDNAIGDCSGESWARMRLIEAATDRPIVTFTKRSRKFECQEETTWCGTTSLTRRYSESEIVFLESYPSPTSECKRHAEFSACCVW